MWHFISDDGFPCLHRWHLSVTQDIWHVEPTATEAHECLQEHTQTGRTKIIALWKGGTK